ncbi:c-type cytochrome [Microvirga puerhi]|uniref:Cytochrome c n=1 Tax=Microvirga puerhi TaxID=2876078 RepID=A0ABS7VJZ7_9HYPH|nr:cytochrome c [Microvirga puerhi]MBZ6075390.1 cytochrome c [Microvirga puerhi]
MRKAVAVLVGLVVLGIIAFMAFTSPTAWEVAHGEPGTGSEAAALRRPDPEKGRIVFLAGGCSSCHATPGQDDKMRLGGGLALKSPFGTFHVPNLSPHKQDGIGNWSQADFIRAMREGVSPEGEHLYPAFPYTSYQRMTVTDLKDLFAFLQALPPVEGRAPPHDLSFPFNIRRGVGLWKLAFLDGHVFMSDPDRSSEWNRGAYLVEGPGHCAECHSERNAMGAIMADRRFAGGPDPEGKGVVPNITPSPSGIGGWSPEEVVTLLTTGETPTFDTVSGPMALVVHNTAQLPEADRKAIAEYILSLPPKVGYKKPQ